jgi:hypothetical protein
MINHSTDHATPIPNIEESPFRYASDSLEITRTQSMHRIEELTSQCASESSDHSDSLVGSYELGLRTHILHPRVSFEVQPRVSPDTSFEVAASPTEPSSLEIPRNPEITVGGIRATGSVSYSTRLQSDTFDKLSSPLLLLRYTVVVVFVLTFAIGIPLYLMYK